MEKQERCLEELARRDEIYQQLLGQCKQAEEDYLHIMAGLCETDREAMDRYVMLCEEMESRRTWLALCCLTETRHP